MLFFLAIVGAVLSWKASGVAIQYGAPANVAELAPLLAVLSACLWAIRFLSTGGTLSQLWLALAPIAWLAGAVVGAHVYLPGDEELLSWLPTGWQTHATLWAPTGYMICVGLSSLPRSTRDGVHPTSIIRAAEKVRESADHATKEPRTLH